MGKQQTIYTCANCDAQFPKWEGRCRECGKWDTLKESVRSAPVVSSAKAAAVIDFASLAAEANAPRESTGSVEFDRVLGGGLVPGALVLIGGDPGIGKSTLLLQVAAKMIDGPPREALSERRGGLYISGEESAEQIKNRMDRLNLSA